MKRYRNLGTLIALVLLCVCPLLAACGTLEVGIARTPTPQASPTPGPTETVPAPTPTSTVPAPTSTSTATALPTATPSPASTPTPQPPTPTPEPEHRRIRFAAGATDAMMIGTLPPGGAERYVLRALAGQALILDVTAPHPVLLSVWGADGAVLKRAVGGTSHWEGELPSTQDYFLELASAGPGIDYRMAVTIPGLVEPTPSLNTYRNEEHDFEIQYPSDFAVEVTCSPEAVTADPVVGFRLIGDRYYAGTNLLDACVVIGVDRSAEARATCLEPRPIEEYLGQEQINAITFSKGSRGGVAAGNIYDVTSYRTLHHDACYEIALFLHSHSLGVYSPGTISEFDRQEVIDRLVQILHTFRFIGHVSER